MCRVLSNALRQSSHCEWLDETINLLLLGRGKPFMGLISMK